MSDREAIREELEQIRLADRDNMLRPEAVVAFARKPETHLHAQFCWDDTEAARQYRLFQARNLIRVAITMIGATPEPFRAYVSLTADRAQPGGGYRSINDVMSHAATRNQLVEEAYRDFLRFRKKYESIRSLVPLFAVAERIFRRHRRVMLAKPPVNP